MKVSIITPVLNCRNTIETNLQSVESQRYDNIEHIVVDGGSTDGTQEILKKYKKISLISGKDKTIADAMNKGMKLATGDIIGILNADDYYLSDSINVIAENHKEYPDCVLHGNMRVFSSSGEYYDSIAPKNPLFLKGMVINHPTMFIPINILNKHGMYDEEFKINGDWELCIRYYLAGVKFKNINKIITHYNIGGVSTTKPKVVFDEMHKVRKKYKLYKYIDFRYLREKILLFFFRNKVTMISHWKRIYLDKIKRAFS